MIEMMLENKKGSSWSMEQIIGMILVIVVVIGVLMFIFKPNILNYIRILPGFNLPDEDVSVDFDDLSPEEISALGLQCAEDENGNKIIIAEIKDGYVHFVDKTEFDYLNGFETPFYFEGANMRNGVIIWDNWGGEVFGFEVLGGNDEIGTVENYKIDIKDEWIVKTDWIKTNEHKLLRNAMLYLDDKMFVEGQENYICQTEKIEIE